MRHISLLALVFPLACNAWTSTTGVATTSATGRTTTTLFSTATMAHLEDPTARDAHYALSPDQDGSAKLNVAQYLLDLHDSRATFDFCGGMLFQLVLTDALRAHLETVASDPSSQQQPVLFDATHPRMSHVPQYSKMGHADSVSVFHGRELRSVPTAAGGMGMVLQLSLAAEDVKHRDPEGWSVAEETGYDGWGHDSGRDWRTADRYENEGFANFKEQFGSSAFGLNHRFYLHLDWTNRMWLSAEDGCEGTLALVGGKKKNPLSQLMGW